jgi:hypothetical protein
MAANVCLRRAGRKGDGAVPGRADVAAAAEVTGLKVAGLDGVGFEVAGRGAAGRA